MKKYFLVIVLMAISLVSFADDNDIRRFNIQQNTNVPFRLFPTNNTWNFLKLDTRTGQIWGVQYYVGDESWGSRATTYSIATIPIETATKENVGRFTLIPTNNFHNFILLDQINGRTWQVQFDINDSLNNFRKQIY